MRPCLRVAIAAASTMAFERAWACTPVANSVQVYNPTPMTATMTAACPNSEALEIRVSSGVTAGVACDAGPVTLTIDGTSRDVQLGQCVDLVWSNGKFRFR